MTSVLQYIIHNCRPLYHTHPNNGVCSDVDQGMGTLFMGNRGHWAWAKWKHCASSARRWGSRPRSSPRR